MLVEYVNYLVPLLFLLVLSIIDMKTFNLKYGAIPSIITTMFLIFSFLISLNPITTIFSILMGMLLVDLDFFAGVPDWKVIVACGMVLPNIVTVLIFGVMITLFGTIFKFIAKLTKWKEVPLIPIIALGYIATLGVLLL